MTTDKPGRESDQFALRLPDGMRERIKNRAAANNRSMNAEIVSALFAAYPPPEPDDDFKKLAALIEQMPDVDVKNFFNAWLAHVPIEDIEDGLIPGVRAIKE